MLQLTAKYKLDFMKLRQEKRFFPVSNKKMALRPWLKFHFSSLETPEKKNFYCPLSLMEKRRSEVSVQDIFSVLFTRLTPFRVNEGWLKELTVNPARQISIKGGQKATELMTLEQESQKLLKNTPNLMQKRDSQALNNTIRFVLSGWGHCYINFSVANRLACKGFNKSSFVAVIFTISSLPLKHFIVSCFPQRMLL